MIESLTFTASKMALRRKAIAFQSRFPPLASVGTFSSGNCVWERNVQQKKKKKKKEKRKETEEQAPMRDFWEELPADIKSIGKFCLCSVTLQVFKW